MSLAATVSKTGLKNAQRQKSSWNSLLSPSSARYCLLISEDMGKSRMYYYHVRITRKSEPHDIVALDLGQDQLSKRILQPYANGNPIVILGTIIPTDDLKQVRITRTQDHSSKILPIVQAERAQSRVKVLISDDWFVADKGEDVTDAFITAPPGPGELAGPAKIQDADKVGRRRTPSDSEPTWDLFICHASEDKDEVARPLAEALTGKGLSVWYDEFTLTLGDSLSTSIDYGLANSRFGVVILSPAFFNKEWPKRELDGLTAKEISSGKTILPIWHNVERDYVLRYSPILADKLAVSISEGLDRVVTEIQKAVSKDGALKGALREHVTPSSERPFKEESKARPSTTAAVEAVKLYLGDSRNRIQLHDLIHKETESVYQKFVTDQFVSRVDPFTKGIFQERMHTYETIVERLVAMMVALSYHDTGDNSPLLSRCIERIAEQMRHDGLSALLDLQLYPALLITYGTGLSALAANRFRNLAAILKDPKYYDRYSGKDKPTICDVNVPSVFEHSEKWVPRSEAEREYTPANNYLFDLLRPVLREYLPGDRKYEETFDIFEYLLALTYSDIVDTRWAPVGRFGWRVKRPGYEATGLSGFVDNGLKLGDAWDLLRAGFFNGSIERFKEIAKIHATLLQKQTQGWI